MISMEKINFIWNEIHPERGNSIARRVDPNHPLDYFVGYDENSLMQLMLVTDSLPELPKSSQQIHVRGNLRGDGRYAICFSLTNTVLREIFILLCWDIMSCSYEVDSKLLGISMAIKRFCMWQILLAKSIESKISDSQIKGLMGELAVLRDVCIPKYDSSNALNGWIGPLQSDRDFEYEDTWYEVKAVSLSKETILISSFDQLDVLRPGCLIVCRLEKTSVSDPKAITLNTLIDQITNRLKDNGHASSIFLARLKLYGFDNEDNRADIPFIIHGFEIYRVSDDFPRLRRSEINSSICNGEYTLSIAAIQPWRE